MGGESSRVLAAFVLINKATIRLSNAGGQRAISANLLKREARQEAKKLFKRLYEKPYTQQL